MVVAVAASPSSAPPTAADRSHPAYKEMIVQALTELREPGGSTRLAIAKYVADRFSGLPASHDALLYAHLRRLESEGVLRTYGCFYDLSSAPKQRRGRGRPPKIQSPAALAPPSGEKRGRGRPRKNAVPVESSSAVHPQPAVKLEPGRPPKTATPVAADVPVLGEKRGRGRPRRRYATPVAAAVPVLGEKRGRGRPRKNTTSVAAAVPVLGEKRGRGRPPKIKNALVLTATLVEKLDGKRRPGRPRKSVVTTGAVQGSSENAVVSAGVAGARRGRGRPPKAKLPAHVGAAALAMLSLALGKRKRGRPRKAKPLQLGSVLSANAAWGKRGPGRPRKEKTVEVSPSEAGGVVAVEMTEAGPIEDGAEAEPVQPVGETGAVQNGSGASSLQSGGASSAQKRRRGRPRKEKPSETEPADIGVSELVEKRARGRPRKEKPSTTSSAETGNGTSMGIKRGRGRPRKDRSFETGFAQPAGQVFRDLTEARPTKENDLVSGEKIQTEGVTVGDSKETRNADAGYVPVFVENAASAPVEAGFAEPEGQVSRDLAEARPTKDKDLVPGEKIQTEGVTFRDRKETGTADVECVMVSGENAASAPVEAGGANDSTLGSM